MTCALFGEMRRFHRYSLLQVSKKGWLPARLNGLSAILSLSNGTNLIFKSWLFYADALDIVSQVVDCQMHRLVWPLVGQELVD